MRTFFNCFILAFFFLTTATAGYKSFYTDDVVIGTLSVGKSTVPDTKAIMELVSTTKGFLPPRMTTTQRDNISSPPTGLVVFNTTTNKVNAYNGTAWVEVGGGAGGLYAGGQNLLTNNSWETDTTNWTASGGSYSRNTTVDHLIPPGVGSGSWDPSAGSQTLTSNSTTITANDGLSGQNGVYSCAVKTASTDVIMQVYDGTNVLSSTTISSPSGFVRHSVNFIFPSSGTISGRFISASDSAVMYPDDCFMGKSEGFNTYQTSQAELYGRITVSSCASNWTRSDATFGAFGTVASCSYSTVNNASSPSTNIPAIKFSSLPPGNYLFIARSQFGKNITTTNTSAGFRFHDGTNSFGENAFNISSSSGQANYANMISGFKQYTTAQSNITIQIQGKTSTTASSTYAQLGPSNNSESNAVSPDLEIDVFRYPLASETGYRADQAAFFVDANISGSDFVLSASDQASYIEMTNASMTLTNNAAGTVTAQIACASGTASTGTTCSVNESNGIAFTIPKAGTYKACVSFSHYVNMGSANNFVGTTFQVVETTNTSSAVVAEGNSRLLSFPAYVTTSVGITTSLPQQNCGTFKFSSTGQKTLRLEYEQDVTNSPTTNVVLGAATASFGSYDIHWTVEPITQETPAPLLVNSVLSNSSGIERIERALITYSGGTPSVSSQSGSWISSVTDVGTGQPAPQLVAGIFSSAPHCVCSTKEDAVSGSACMVTSTSTSAIGIRTRDLAATLSDENFYLICMGAK